MTLKEMRTLLDEGKVITIHKDENGYAVEVNDLVGSSWTDVTDQVTYEEESAALDTLIDSLFEYGDVLFDPDGPNGPLLIINNVPNTEISLTKKQAEALQSVGVPCFADVINAPSFEDMCGEAVKAPSFEDMCGGKVK